MIDVGSEWRTFTNEKATKDPSRVGDAQNPLLNGGDLTTMISKVRTKHLDKIVVFKGLGLSISRLNTGYNSKNLAQALQRGGCLTSAQCMWIN